MEFKKIYISPSIDAIMEYVNRLLSSDTKAKYEFRILSCQNYKPYKASKWLSCNWYILQAKELKNIYSEIEEIQKPIFDEILGLKKRIVQYYRKHRCFEKNSIDRFAKIFSTHKDMIRAMSFMKYELNKDEFTGADFEEIYNN